MHKKDITETNDKNRIFCTFGHAVRLTFNLLTPQPNQFIYNPRYTNGKSGKNPSMHTIAKTISPTDARTDGRMT